MTSDSQPASASLERDVDHDVDVLVVGAGIVGLSTAMHLVERVKGIRLLVVDKEDRVAAHQSGHNSGVIHSGLYYRPGSLNATMAKAGAASMVRFCREHDIAHEVCGKLVVAASTDEVAGLERLYERGLANGLAVERLDGAAAIEREPHVDAVAAMWVPSTGIADYPAVVATYARLVREGGGELALSHRVTTIAAGGGAGHRVALLASGATRPRWVRARAVVNCAGLHADRLAREAGADPRAQIVPFRGEYVELRPGRRHLVNGLIYPVPNPDFPFLGVHATRMIDGSVHAGPNAVLAFRREGYRMRDVNVRDLVEIVGYRGFRRLAAKHWQEGTRELWRSISRRAFVRSLQRLVPEIGDDDVVPTHAGVRAQALAPDGSMVDDFLVIQHDGGVHVCNAPSPAATASLEIGRHLASMIELPRRHR